ncbi:MAG: polysaccharide deacetylase family protein [Aquabacterium sp.]
MTKLVHEVLLTRRDRLALTPGGEVVELGRNDAERRASCYVLLKHLKRVSNAERIATLARWSEEMGVKDAPDARGLHRPMNWDHVKTLSDAGIEIGSHTVTHPVLSRIQDPAELG